MRSLVLAALSFLALAPSAVQASPYSRVVIVADDGSGDFLAPDDALRAAPGAPGAPGWCPSPSESAPCLVKIMPGLYDIGTDILTLNGFIDVEGSGETVTTIVGSGTVIAQINGAAELRQVTISARSDSVYTAVQILSGAAKARLTHTTISVTGGVSIGKTALNARGTCDVSHTTILMRGASEQLGVLAYGTLSTLENPLVLEGLSITVECTTPGIHATGVRVRTPARIIDSSIRVIGGAYGVTAEHATWLERVRVESEYYGVLSSYINVVEPVLSVDASQIVAPYPLIVSGSKASAYVGASRLAGQVLTTGFKRCVASYGADYKPLDANCLPLP
jgi:hypothetical protein